MNKRITNYVILLIIFVVGASLADVHYLKNNDISLKSRWESALKESASMKDEYIWIGYSYCKMMDTDTRISSGFCSKAKMLGEIIYDRVNDNEKEIVYEDTIAGYAKRVVTLKKQNKSDVLKEVAVLFLINSKREVIDILCATMDSRVSLRSYAVIWMGKIKNNNDESLNFLIDLYHQEDSAKLKIPLHTAIANHTDKATIVDFLINEASSKVSYDVKKSATFWLGIQDDPKAIAFLEKMALSLADVSLSKEAVFAVYLGRSGDSMDSLIRIAHQAGDREVRKQAIFWLGQKASEKTSEILSEMVFSSNEIDVQKTAVFALSQTNSMKAISKLAEVARSHPSAEVRKEAIFWLGQTDSDEALEVLTQIAKSK